MMRCCTLVLVLLTGALAGCDFGEASPDCAVDSECAPGSVCVSGSCVEPTEVDVVTSGEPTVVPPEEDVVPAEPEASPVSFAQVDEQVLRISCSFETCHGTDITSKNGGLDLREGVAFESLVGVAPLNAAALADGMQLVAPGDPNNSFLLFKLELSWDDEERHDLYGLPMPSVPGAALDTERIELVRSWIAQGAPGP